MSADDEFDIGDHAEGQFDLWCREVQILATPPRKDKRGWDFHLSLPSLTQDDVFDEPPSLACSAQVKGQWEKTKQPPKIKLSNWKRMIHEPVPWFICVVLYTPANTPVRCAFVHVDEKWVTETAKRLWKHKASKSKKKLHELEMRVSWEQQQIIEAPNGAKLLQAIRRYVGKPEDYLRQKLKWLRDAGVKDGKKHQVQVSFAEPDQSLYYKNLAALAVGEIDEVNASRVVSSEVRFNIPIQKDNFEEVVIKLGKRPSSGKTLVRFTEMNPVRQEFEVAFDTYSASSIFPFLPKEYRRVKLVTPLLDLDIRANGPDAMTLEWSLSVGFEDEVKLEDLARATRALGSLLDSTAPPPAFKPPKGSPQSIPLQDGTSPGSAEELEALELVEVSKYAALLARAFDLSLERTIVRVSDLLVEASQLRSLASIFSGSTPDVSLRIEDASRKLDGLTVGYATAPGVRVGGELLLLVLVVTGKAQWRSDLGGQALIENPKVRVVERIMCPFSDAKKKGFLKKRVGPALERAREAIGAEGLTLIRVKEDPV